MRAEASHDLATAPRKPRRTAGDRLRAAVLALAGDGAELLRHSESGWASITFTGTRHRLELRFTGDAMAAGEHFIAALPDHEFAIAGQLVADAEVTAADHTLLPTPRLLVICELLLLEES